MGDEAEIARRADERTYALLPDPRILASRPPPPNLGGVFRARVSLPRLVGIGSRAGRRCHPVSMYGKRVVLHLQYGLVLLGEVFRSAVRSGYLR